MIEQLVFPIVIAFASAFIGWFFARKKNVQELESMKLDNEIKSAKYYQSLLDDMSTRLEKAIDQLIVSEERNEKLTKQLILSEERNQNLEQQIREFIEVNKDLVDELQKFKQLNGKQSNGNK
jgi:Tfp pilus assembly protein PilO